MSKDPVLIELEPGTEDAARPDQAPMIHDAPRGPAAMERAVQVAAAPPNRLARWFWAVLMALLGMVLSVAAWDFVTGLLARNAVLGGVATVLVGLFVLLLLGLALREAAGFARLGRVDALRQAAAQARETQDAKAARQVLARLEALYRGRSEMSWGLGRVAERREDVFDADGVLALGERELLGPLDHAAVTEVETAARQVALATALVPLALADVAAALFANLRMIRRVAEIYGGRSGTLGNWRLTRSVMAHLVATGAVAVGDDLLGSVAGGGLLGKLSRRFGEGVINGALTARVGLAAMEVCRPLPFAELEAPSASGVIGRALSGLFGGGDRGA